MSGFGDLDTGTTVIVVAWTAFLALVLPGLLFAYRGKLGRGARHVLVYLGLFFALIAGYAYCDELGSFANRVSGELLPAGIGSTQTAVDGERAVRIRRSSRGPFVARVSLNGSEVLMMIDTGASSVVLKPADAERAGIDIAHLSYTVAVETANGPTYCAPVRVRQISVGGISFQGVEALVAKPGSLSQSLLGMTFLKRLRSYEFTSDFLTLRS